MNAGHSQTIATIESAIREVHAKAFLNLLEDFSEDKQRLEESQLATLNLLEDFAAERCKAEDVSRELLESAERLRLAKEVAEASNRELEAFSYSVSHDLRAPLRHLDGFLTLLSKRSYSMVDATAQHYIDTTLQASRNMGRLIDELLQFSRLGRSRLTKMPVPMNELVEEVRRELEPETRHRTIHWQVDRLPVMEADPGMLRQVLENLLGNALKFTSRRAEAEIVIGSQCGPNGEPAIFVRDNGAGFDMQYYDKLFQVFQRLHGEDEFEGTGIGLANVRRVVERHGGRVWAEGAVDAGATFYFSLPAGNDGNGGQNEHVEAHLASGR